MPQDKKKVSFKNSSISCEVFSFLSYQIIKDIIPKIIWLKKNNAF